MIGTKTVIATETRVVHDPVLGIRRQVIAGQPVPRDLLGAYQQANNAREQAGGNVKAPAKTKGRHPKAKEE